MQDTSEEPQVRCTVCEEVLPESRMSLACVTCGHALHPSCATRIERGPGWGNRAMFCATCAADYPPAMTGLMAG